MAILSRVPSLANGERAFELTAHFTRRKPQAQLVGHQGVLEMFISFLFCIFSLNQMHGKYKLPLRMMIEVMMTDDDYDDMKKLLLSWAYLA